MDTETESTRQPSNKSTDQRGGSHLDFNSKGIETGGFKFKASPGKTK